MILLIDSHIHAHEFRYIHPEWLCKNSLNIGCLFQEIYSIFTQKKVITETTAFKD